MAPQTVVIWVIVVPSLFGVFAYLQTCCWRVWRLVWVTLGGRWGGAGRWRWTAGAGSPAPRWSSDPAPLRSASGHPAPGCNHTHVSTIKHEKWFGFICISSGGRITQSTIDLDWIKFWLKCMKVKQEKFLLKAGFSFDELLSSRQKPLAFQYFFNYCIRFCPA